MMLINAKSKNVEQDRMENNEELSLVQDGIIPRDIE
jgi:hypothetical protein